MRTLAHVQTSLLYLLFLLSLSTCSSTPSLSQWQWQQAEAGLPHQAIVLSVAAEGTQIWAGYYGAGGLAVSQDGGQTWSIGAVGARDNPVLTCSFSPLMKPSKLTNFGLLPEMAYSRALTPV
jgi:hypothetical protein